jgi:hypothetical protein
MDKANPSLLLARLIELEELLQSPAGEYDVKHVDALIMFIARRAPNPSIRGIAMLAMAEVNTLRRNTLAEQDRRKLNIVLYQLRGAIEEVEQIQRR